MNSNHRSLQELIKYYRLQGAPEEQQLLISLLRDAQEIDGDALMPQTIASICESYQIKPAILHALIRRMPSLHFSDTPHCLEVCGTCKDGRALADFIERTYGVKNGSCRQSGGFSYRITGCMKNCKKGPSIRWDGEIVSFAAPDLIRQIIKTGSLPVSEK